MKKRKRGGDVEKRKKQEEGPNLGTRLILCISLVRLEEQQYLFRTRRVRSLLPEDMGPCRTQLEDTHLQEDMSHPPHILRDMGNPLASLKRGAMDMEEIIDASNR